MREFAGIADAADENRVAHFSWAQRGTPGMRAHLDDHMVMTDCGLECDTFNTISRIRFTWPSDPRRVRDVMAWYDEEGRPYSWWVGPADYPRDLGNVLVNAGMRAVEKHHAMVADLHELPQAEAPLAGLEFQPVTSVEQMLAFAATTAARRSPPDPLIQRFFALAAERLLLPTCPRRFFLGLLDGRPVATSELTITGRVAGLYNVVTLPNLRRQGIGTAMAIWSLREATEAGCFVGVLQAPRSTEALFRKIGFESFGEIVEYKPPRRL